MIAVEYYDEYISHDDDNNHLTFEIFETMSEAYNFAATVKYNTSFVADFNTKHIFKEEGKWNYEDVSILYKYAKLIIFSDLIKFN